MAGNPHIRYRAWTTSVLLEQLELGSPDFHHHALRKLIPQVNPNGQTGLTQTLVLPNISNLQPTPLFPQ